jgi:phosphate:Na+ symporter
MSIMGLGMVFFGLELMKDGFAPMKDIPTFVDAFAWFQADSYLGVMKAVLVGCVLTFLVQSSSATLAITIGLAATGVIPFTTAAALVLGENIGTTITVMIASIGANVNAKRASYAHVLFNVFGVLWITAVFPFYIRLVGELHRGGARNGPY